MLEKEGGRERETMISCLPYVPLLRVEPTTWECAVMEDRIHNLLVYGIMLNQLRPPGRACLRHFYGAPRALKGQLFSLEL